METVLITLTGCLLITFGWVLGWATGKDVIRTQSDEIKYLQDILALKDRRIARVEKIALRVYDDYDNKEED